MIEDALRIGSVEDEPPRPERTIIDDRLFDRTIAIGDRKIAETVFILDGWDEVSLTGNAGYQAQLVAWLPKLRQFLCDRPGPPVRLILTGRPSAEVKDNGMLRRDTPILTLRQMRPESLVDYAQRLRDQLENAPAERPAEWAEWKVDLERLKPLFESYRQWFAGDRDGGSLEVLGSPLLAFLALRTLADWQGDAAQLVREPTSLYHALIDTTVRHAGQGRDRRLEETVHIRGAPLRFLLHRVAGVITLLGRESVSFNELDMRLADDADFKRLFASGLAQAAEDQSRLSTLLGLIVSFFFKGGNENLGCEFLHKSFREYLFAESVVHGLEEIAGEAHGPLADPRIAFWQDFSEDTVQYRASRRLAGLLAPQWMTDEVRSHLFWLLDKALGEHRQRWVWLRDLLLDVYVWWAEGVSLRPQPATRRGALDWQTPYMDEMLRHALPFDPTERPEPPRATTLDAHLGEALIQITAFVHHRLMAEPAGSLMDEPAGISVAGGKRCDYRTQAEGGLRFAPGGGGFAAEVFARINAAGWRKPGPFPAGAHLPGIDLAGERLAGLQGYLANLYGADLREANLGGANLREADLREANLGGANLREADLREANLGGANLQEASLYRANLRGANLGGANLREADLRGANLGGANLREADLGGANLRGADLQRANLQRANLQRANLQRADLRGADLRGADLRGADLRGANCRLVHIDSVSLQFADLSSARDLSQEAVNSANGNSATRLPPWIERPAHWQD